MSEIRTEYQRFLAAERKRERRARIGGLLLMGVSTLFMAFIGWCAIVGMTVVFG